MRGSPIHHTLAAALAAVLALAARESAASTETPAPAEGGPGYAWSISANAAFLILPIVDVSGAYRLGASSSVSARAGAGRVSIDLPFGEDETNTIIELGAAYHYYLFGDFEHGLALGGDLRYVNAGTGELLNMEKAVAVGPFAGYKKIFSTGFTLDFRLGGQLALGEVEVPFAPLIHLGAGWSF